jgi:DNA-binding MarR family transcriptional regulator
MTVSKSLKKLASLGLIKRTEHEKDARIKSVHLTSKGKTLASKLEPLVEKIDEHFFGVINSKNQRQLLNLLN